jgi:GNAT superfamily N-acetyltransferase
MIEIRRESPDAPAGRALYAEYLDLVRARLPGYTPTSDVHGTEADLDVWLVAYDGEEPVGCGGLAGDEIKRMFVRAGARGRGHGRRLLAELERAASTNGARRVRLYTTDVLSEALALYRAAGYRLVSTHEVGGRRDHWLEKEIT